MRLRLFPWILMMAMAAAARPPDAVRIRLASDPAVSSDGKSMVFEWADDLWTAATNGGEAKCIVRDPARDAFPRFSPDGKRGVFSSDRSGSLQVYSIPLAGGETERHSWHTEGNRPESVSPVGTRALVRGVREHPGFLATRLLEIDLTSDRRERCLVDATVRSATWSPDGNSVLFCSGGKQVYRKGYQGSRASQIWLYRLRDRSFRREVAEDTEARSPLWLPDGSGFYYVSNRNGTANLWLRRDGAVESQITRFNSDGVITPDISKDGSTLVFRCGLDVWCLHPNDGQKAVLLDLWTRETLPADATDTREITGTSSADFTTDLKQVVFSAAGELWCAPEPGKAPVRLTETAAA